jgi:hypothetical protein
MEVKRCFVVITQAYPTFHYGMFERNRIYGLSAINDARSGLRTLNGDSQADRRCIEEDWAMVRFEAMTNFL